MSDAIQLNKNLVKEFCSAMGADDFSILEADFFLLFVVVDWFNYFDEHRERKNIYPFLLYKKGATVKMYVNQTKYSSAAKIVFQSYLDGALSIEEMNQSYQILAKNIDALYEAYFATTSWNEEQLLKNLEHAYIEIQELVALTLFLDTLNQQTIEETLAKTKNTVDLLRVWDISRLLDFISFDFKNAQEILTAHASQTNPARLQHIFTNYTHVPTTQEVEERVKAFDIEEKRREVKNQQEVMMRNREEKKMRRASLTPEEQNVLTFIDWSSWLRDDRKTLLNKVDALLFDYTSRLYDLWGIDQSLVPLSFVFEVLKGKRFILDHLDAIRRRQDQLMLLYDGKDRYEEEINPSEEDGVLLDKQFLVRHKPQTEDVLTGEIASSGCAKGIVRVVTKRIDFEHFQPGEILVTAMTRPEFVPLMKKAVAIITDEGGLTCHAAIVSRELGKPCIIGTKIATKVLKDGDEVEVDAEKGIVNILKRN